MRTRVIAISGMLDDMSLPIGLVGKLKATLIANKRFDAFMRSHVGIKLVLPEVSFATELTFERS